MKQLNNCDGTSPIQKPTCSGTILGLSDLPKGLSDTCQRWRREVVRGEFALFNDAQYTVDLFSVSHLARRHLGADAILGGGPSCWSHGSVLELIVGPGTSGPVSLAPLVPIQSTYRGIACCREEA